MAMQDNDPERRNLLVTSICVALYYMAGGAIEGPTVRLQVINVTFERPEILALAIWVALIWFAYRYWVTHRGSIRRGLEAEISWLSNDWILKSYVGRQRGEPVVSDGENGQHISHIGIERSGMAAVVRVANDVRRDGTTGRIKSAKGGLDHANRSRVPLRGYIGRLVSVWLLLRCFQAYPTFSSYVVPWLFFALAVGLGVSRHVVLD